MYEALFSGSWPTPMDGTCRSWKSFPDQAKVTLPPVAIFTVAGAQKNRAVPVTPTLALVGFPLEGGVVGVGGTDVGGGGLFPPDAVGGTDVALGATVDSGVGVAAGAVALVADATTEADADGAAADAVGLTVAAPEGVAVASVLELEPPQALIERPRARMASGTSRRIGIVLSWIVLLVFWPFPPVCCDFPHKENGHRDCDGHSS